MTDPGVVMKIMRNNELKEKSLIDPVGKFRVCEPQTLIDTDFEYGLQGTKWETLELVNNIPTFYSRDNDESLSLSNIVTTQNSYNVYVYTNSNHNLIVGSPVIVSGVSSFSAEGSYVVNGIISSNVFVYRAKSLQTSTGSIYDSIATNVYIGKLYQGTQYSLDSLGYIRTDGTNQIIVDTNYPHGFSENTSFILSKSVGQKQLVVANCNIDTRDAFSYSNTVFTTSNNILSNINPYTVDNVIVHDWESKVTAYVDNTDVDATSNIITCSNHGLLNDDTVMYVPALLTLSNIDASYKQEHLARMPPITNSNFVVAPAYSYTYDGGSSSISTGGSSMFDTGSNNVHYFGTSTTPTFVIPYTTTSWTNFDATSDYKTFGQTNPFCTVVRIGNGATYYYRIDVANTGAQVGTIHERYGTVSASRNNFYYRWNAFGLYGNGTRPSFYYLITTFQSIASTYPTNNLYSGTATTTISSLSYVYQVGCTSSYNPAYTVVMLISRQNGTRILQGGFQNIVNTICDYFETFTDIMGEYRLSNSYLYNYDNAGDYYINNGGSSMFDNNKLGNLLYIDGQLLSYRDRIFTNIGTSQHVEYKFLSDCHPQIMLARVMQSRNVQFRISDTWASGSGTAVSSYWYSVNSGNWLCYWGYHSLYSRSGRPTVHRIFMGFNYLNYWPSLTMNTANVSNTSTDIRFTFNQNNNFYPGYVAIALFAQPPGSSVPSWTVFQNIVICILNNAQYVTSTSWPLTLVKTTWPDEFQKYNVIGNLRPHDIYQVNYLNPHQFQLMDIPRNLNRINYSAYVSGFIPSTGWTNGNTSTNVINMSFDVTTNMFNLVPLQNSSYVSFVGNYYGYQTFRIALVDDTNVERYSSTITLGGGYYYGSMYYLSSFGAWGSATDPVRRYTSIRVTGITSGNYYTNDCIQLYFNNIIPSYNFPPTSRPIKAITQGSTKEYIGKHAFMKAYRVHSFSAINAPSSSGYYFNFLRSANDSLSIVSNDDVYLMHHPDITGIDSTYGQAGQIYNTTNTTYSGPCVPRFYFPSYDNIKFGNSTKYNVRTNEFGIASTYSYARLNLSGVVQTGGDRNWWPGTSWLIVARDIQSKNTICIPNHNIPLDTAIQIEDVAGNGIREVDEGVYYALPYNTDLIRLKTSTATTSNIDFTAYDGTMKIYYSIPNSNRDTVYVPDHGLFEGTPIVYTAASNVIYPLVNTNTYYAFGVTKDRFGLSVNKTTRLNLGGTELFEDVSLATSIGTGNIIASLSGATLITSGTGSGATGGFATLNGGKYILLNSATTREVVSKVLNLTDGANMTIYAIGGNNTNGGGRADAGEELYAAYSLNGSNWTDIGIIAGAAFSPTWTTASVTVPLAARTSNSYLKLYQKSTSGANTDMYGVQYIKIDSGTSINPTDVHYLAVGGIGAVDGTYVTSSVAQNSSLLTLVAPYNIPPKILYVNPLKVVNTKDNTLYIPLHSMISGALVKYKSNGNTAISPLVDNTDYYITRIDENHVKVASTYANALNGVYITLVNVGSGTNHTLLDYSVGGETLSTYTLSGNSGSILLTGQTDANGATLTTFTSEFRVGNLINVIVANTAYDDYSVSTIDTGNYTITLNKTITFSTGDAVVFAPSNPKNTSTAINSGSITPLVQGYIYYAVVTGPTTMRLFNTYSDAMTSTNVIQVASGTGVFTSLKPSNVVSRKIISIKNNKFIEVDNAYDASFSNCKYFLSTNLIVKADGFALHRPFDGGVELIPPKNTDSQMIRQTRKYFRYQSGKGIQVSLAINFSAPVDIDNLYRIGNTAYLVTKRPHRLSSGLTIVVEGSLDNVWNGVYLITSTPDVNVLTFSLSSIPLNTSAPGNMTFFVKNWNNSALRCGLYDDQNGMFYEYDGNSLYCVRRSSVLQLSGTCTVTFNSPVVQGLQTLFASQLSVYDMIVIKGQSYKVVSIESNTKLFIQPVYRGISRSGCIITKTVEVRAPQNQWSIDKCDGNGPTSYNLNINKIQMAYMDYSWYGAGKVRFGFKDRFGDVRYIHEFIHNNYQNEAYLRSGNLPCRYEVVNKGYPTYVPALMHWGTSVIMDGKFDDDKAYLFTAAGQLLSYQGNDQLTLTSTVASINYLFGGNYNAQYTVYDSTTRTNVIAFAICTTFANYDVVKNVRSGSPITGTNIQANTVTVSQPIRYNNTTYGTVIYINKPPTGSYAGGSAVIGSASDTIPNVIPLISIRLSPSVDNSRPGVLGAREVINRMQLMLRNVGVLTTHDCEIRLLLNGSIDNRTWQRVTPPSLSQLIYHGKGDSVDNGTQIFNFRIPGGSAPTSGAKRTATSTTYDLSELVTLGNSIQGGDGIFPDGPDLLTIAASVLDLSDISSTAPFTITGRVTWTESQA